MDLPDWLERAPPSQLAVFLSKRASPRKAGLFVRHLCRCFPDIFTNPRSLAALDAADRFEAGEIDHAAYLAAVAAASRASVTAEAVYNPWSSDPAESRGRARAAATAARIAHEVALTGYYPAVLGHLRHAVLDHAGVGNPPRKNPIAPVLRPVFFEHFGDTEWPITLDSTWRTEAVVGLATGIDSERAFDRMPVLADALEDAGCAHPDVLTHCRAGGPHARGCWVVDLLLGRA